MAAGGRGLGLEGFGGGERVLGALDGEDAGLAVGDRDDQPLRSTSLDNGPIDSPPSTGRSVNDAPSGAGHRTVAFVADSSLRKSTSTPSPLPARAARSRPTPPRSAAATAPCGEEALLHRRSPARSAFHHADAAARTSPRSPARERARVAQQHRGRRRSPSRSAPRSGAVPTRRLPISIASTGAASARW